MSATNPIVRRFERANIAYNRDCNLRLLGPGVEDERRRRLKAKADKAFQALLRYAGALRVPENATSSATGGEVAK